MVTRIIHVVARVISAGMDAVGSVIEWGVRAHWREELDVKEQEEDPIRLNLMRFPWRDSWREHICSHPHAPLEALLDARTDDAGLSDVKEVAAFKALCLTGEDLSYAYAYADGVGNKIYHRLFKAVVRNPLSWPIALSAQLCYEVLLTQMRCLNAIIVDKKIGDKPTLKWTLSVVVCMFSLVGIAAFVIAASPLICLEQARQKLVNP